MKIEEPAKTPTWPSCPGVRFDRLLRTNQAPRLPEFSAGQVLPMKSNWEPVQPPLATPWGKFLVIVCNPKRRP
jgi:hypothetical protein